MQFVLRHNKDRSIKFAPVQSALGRRVLHYYGLPADSYETMLYLENDQLYVKIECCFKDSETAGVAVAIIPGVLSCPEKRQGLVLRPGGPKPLPAVRQTGSMFLTGSRNTPSVLGRMNEKKRSWVHGLARVTVALVWVYHGVVPKLLGPHRDELHLAAIHGLPADHLSLLLKVSGALEVVFGVVVLAFWRSRWPFVVSAVALTVLLVDVAVVAPEYLLGAFNPVSLNLSVISLSIIGFITARQGADSCA